MITIQAAIFDIDGTLLDSVDLHTEAWRRAFREFGKVIPARRIRSQIGKGGDELLPVFLGADEIRAFGKQITEYRSQIFKHDLMPHVKPFPRVRELFEAIRQRGIRTALASSCKKDELDHYKAILNIADLVEENASADDAKHSKPHPDIFEAALARLGMAANRAVAIGDTPYDAQAAGKAGIRTAGVLCGGFPKELLVEAGCFRIFKNPANLLADMEAWILV